MRGLTLGVLVAVALSSPVSTAHTIDVLGGTLVVCATNCPDSSLLSVTSNKVALESRSRGGCGAPVVIGFESVGCGAVTQASIEGQNLEATAVFHLHCPLGISTTSVLRTSDCEGYAGGADPWRFECVPSAAQAECVLSHEDRVVGCSARYCQVRDGPSLYGVTTFTDNRPEQRAAGVCVLSPATTRCFVVALLNPPTCLVVLEGPSWETMARRDVACVM